MHVQNRNKKKIFDKYMFQALYHNSTFKNLPTYHGVNRWSKIVIPSFFAKACGLSPRTGGQTMVHV